MAVAGEPGKRSRDDSTGSVAQPRRTDQPGRRRGLGQLRAAVSGRATLFVLAVLALELGFIASYIAAFHAPKPRRIPLAVVAPAGAPPATAGQLAAQLDRLPGNPLRARPATSETEARRLIADRTVAAALVAGPTGSDRLLVATAGGASLGQAVTAVVQAVEQGQGRTVRVTDVRPPSAGDARGLSSFYLAVGWVVGGYLVAAILGIVSGNRTAGRQRAILRLGVLAGYAVASGVGGVLIVQPVLSALPGSFLALAGFGALLVFAVGAVTMGLQALLGTVGIGVAILLFVVLGNPSAGGPYPAPLLPPFWAAIGGWLPPGAGTSAIRGIAYFGSSGLAGPVLLLAGYGVVGSVLTVLLGHRAATTEEGAAIAAAAPAAAG